MDPTGVPAAFSLSVRCSTMCLRPSRPHLRGVPLPVVLRPCELLLPLKPSRRSLFRRCASSWAMGGPAPSCSLERNGESTSCNGPLEDVNKPSRNRILQVVLVSPQIPGNTGCIARSCAASAVGLHLVEPLGYTIEDSKLKRAGLDYWPYVVVKVHRSWAEFREYFRKQDGEKRLLAFTKRGASIHSDFRFKRGDWLVFGSEPSGLPPEALLDCSSEGLGGGTIRIPMVDTYVRCLNLSVSVGIALYEASRQLNYEQLQNPSEAGDGSERLFLSEDIFA